MRCSSRKLQLRVHGQACGCIVFGLYSLDSYKDFLLFQEEKKKLWNFLVINSN